MEPAEEHARKGERSAKVTYRSQQGIAALILTDYDIGPMGVRDWSYFKFFKCVLFNPQEMSIPLHVKIKDRSEREIDREIDAKAGENMIVFDLEDLGQQIDLRNIVYINFYLMNPPHDLILYLVQLSLERGDLKEKRVLGAPVVHFERASCPARVKRGESVTISAFLSLSQALRGDYRVFIHVAYLPEMRKMPSHPRWYINADQDPWIPTSKWAPRTPYEIGPISIYIPKDFPLGEYAIQIGLFNSDSPGIRSRHSTNRGMVDFRQTFPRLRYANPDIKEYVVAKIEVI
jgi:hypothetical protein